MDTGDAINIAFVRVQPDHDREPSHYISLTPATDTLDVSHHSDQVCSLCYVSATGNCMYTVSQKRDPDIIDCNFYKSRAIAGTTARCAQYMSAQIIM